MAKGAESKAKFISEILKTFEGSFLYNGGKEIRVPMQEDGNDIQLKITITCAKEIVNAESENAIPGAAEAPVEKSLNETQVSPAEPPQMTEAERQNVENLMKALNF